MCVGFGMEKKRTKLKARRMWATRETGEPERLHKTKSDAAGWDYAGGYDARPNSVYRVAVIPLDDVEAIVVAAAAAHYKAWSGTGKPANGDCMRAALVAIGVLPRAKKGRK